MISITVNIEQSEVRGLLNALNRALGPVNLMRILLTDVTSYLDMRSGRRFADEGDELTGPWAPLKFRTELMREAAGFPRAHPINERTGELKRFILGSATVGPVVEGAELTLPGQQPTGTLAEKFTTAQKGSTKQVSKGFSPTPPRPVLAFGPVDFATVLELVMNDIQNTIRSGIRVIV